MDRITNILGVQSQSASLLSVDRAEGPDVIGQPGSPGSGSMALQLLQARRELTVCKQQLEEQIVRRLEAEQFLQTARAEKNALLGTISARRIEDEILKAVDQERERIGQDLHDSLGQYLSGVKFLCTALAQKAAENAPITHSEVSFIEQRINAALAQTRGLAKGLCLFEFEQKGLVSALHDLAAELEALQIQCAVECAEPVEIPSHEVARELYQIAREATANAIKHGKARSISIVLGSDSTIRLFLKITNDGAPFSRGPTQSTGMGLKLMHSRARKIGAQIAIGTGQRDSVSVCCYIPKAI